MVLALVVGTAGCAGEGAGGEFPEDTDEVTDGKADRTGLYSFYEGVPDNGRGARVRLVNRKTTRCGDGKSATDCPVARLVIDALDLDGATRHGLQGQFWQGHAVVRGKLVTLTTGEVVLVASEGWQDVLPDAWQNNRLDDISTVPGTWVLLDDDASTGGVRERKLNSSRTADRDGWLPAATSGLDDRAVALAVAAGHRDSALMVVGDLDGQARVAGRAYLKVERRAFDGCEIFCDVACADATAAIDCFVSPPVAEAECFADHGVCRRGDDGGCRMQRSEAVDICEAE